VAPRLGPPSPDCAEDQPAVHIENYINGLRALAPPSPRPRSQTITPPAPHSAAPLEPQAQRDHILRA